MGQDRRVITAEQVAADLADHLEHYALHRNEYLERQAHQDATQEANLKAIRELTASTAGLVNAWTVANGFNHFVVWVSKFAVLGAAGAWVARKFIFKH